MSLTQVEATIEVTERNWMQLKAIGCSYSSLRGGGVILIIF